MSRTAFVISTAFVAALGCGGREGDTSSCSKGDLARAQLACLRGGTEGGAEADTSDDASPENHDAGPDASVRVPAMDARALDSGAEAFSQWWDPACAVAGGECVDPNCHPIELWASANSCGPFTTLSGGCVLNTTATTGNSCFVRLTDHEVIVSTFFPSLRTGLEPCFEAGLTSGPGVPFPECSDAESSDSAVDTCESLGAVTLTMRARVDASAYCYLAVDYSTNNSWLTITTAAGDPLPIVWPPGTSACSQCLTGDHGIGGNYSVISDGGGVSVVWQALVFPQSTCVSSTFGELMCVNPTCASAGHYIAVMCAYPNGCPSYPPGISPANSSYDAGQQVCVKVPFDYPSTAEVVGILGQ